MSKYEIDYNYWRDMEESFRQKVKKWLEYNASRLAPFPSYSELAENYSVLAKASVIAPEEFVTNWKKIYCAYDDQDLIKKFVNASRRFRKPHRLIDHALKPNRIELKYGPKFTIYTEDDFFEYDNYLDTKWTDDISLVVDHAFYALYVAWKPETKIIVANNNQQLLKKISVDKQFIKQISPRQFEELIAYLYECLGCKVELTQASRDFGADILAWHSGPFKSENLIAIQVKRYIPPNKVGLKGIYELHGAISHYHADTGHVVTSSDYSGPARLFAESQRIHLVGMQDLQMEIDKIYK